VDTDPQPTARERPGLSPVPAPVRSADELLVEIGRGNRQAFAAFYDLTAPRVYGVVRSVLRDPARSEEVTQEVMVELWRTAPRYDASMGSALTWATTIAHRRAVDRVRSEQSSREREARDQRERSATAPVPDVATVAERRLDIARVQAALEQLSPTQRESIELAFFGGHTHREVAALLDLPLGTVKTRIRDGLIRLRDHLEVAT
jgi:RNA polymerase sigma-70 factor (ECF subfamily)